jgi:hypothetical protein
LEGQFLIVALMTFLIHLISTLSYSVRIVGVRTGRIAVSFALFNIMVLVSRSANALQAPLLAKTVETNIKMGISDDILSFRFILLASAVATVTGGLLIPSFQRIFSRAVIRFSTVKSIPKLVLHSFSKSGVTQFKDNIKLPDKKNLTRFVIVGGMPYKIIILNIVAVAILSVGVLAALYAGYLNPELRTTSSTLSSVVNFFATLLMFVFIDPFLSAMTDDVVMGKYSEAKFRHFIVMMVAARFVGTLLAQFLFIPAAHIIVYAAEFL